MEIDTSFDGGKIDIVDDGTTPEIELALLPDNAASFMQWFAFEARGEEDEAHAFRIVNAGEATYATGFEGYSVAASYGDDEWFRIDTTYEDGALTFVHEPEQPNVLYAYYPLYSFDRVDALITTANMSDRVRVETLGESTDGRPVRVVVIGDERPGALKLWTIARQHPGEVMASWFAEELIDRMTDEDDDDARIILESAVLYVVPAMNPDGIVRGNHRTNAAGRDLNRQWKKPGRATSPEVFAVRRAMMDGGCDLLFDVHGDEDIPYLFAAGYAESAYCPPHIAEREDTFLSRLQTIDPDFQREQGYPPGDGPDLRMAGDWALRRFGCLSLTLEMPFLGNANRPSEDLWMPSDCASFARSIITCLAASMDDLR